MLIAIAAFVAVGLVYALGGPVTGFYVAAHAFGTLLCIGLGELWMRTRFVTRELAGLSLLGLAAFAIAYPRSVSAPPYAAVADALRPHVAAARPGYPSFVARDCDVLQGYLDRSGVRFEDLAADPERVAADANLKAFVIAPSDAGRPRVEALSNWLAAHAQEIALPGLANTGTDPGYRLFVR
jgi:hypothetical protein